MMHPNDPNLEFQLKFDPILLEKISDLQIRGELHNITNFKFLAEGSDGIVNLIKFAEFDLILTLKIYFLKKKNIKNLGQSSCERAKNEFYVNQLAYRKQLPVPKIFGVIKLDENIEKNNIQLINLQNIKFEWLKKGHIDCNEQTGYYGIIKEYIPGKTIQELISKKNQSERNWNYLYKKDKLIVEFEKAGFIIKDSHLSNFVISTHLSPYNNKIYLIDCQSLGAIP
ncbi:MAG: hypothetical protein OEY49_06355 [Candidatus Heimdallarchaeota archaeon]|nr:hypothetical protein [Candidatus Heimdallarchaeota archaeon]